MQDHCKITAGRLKALLPGAVSRVYFLTTASSQLSPSRVKLWDQKSLDVCHFKPTYWNV
jgi:hypothetical protein